MSTSAQPILAFLSQTLAAGGGAALVTVTDVTGASVRNPGAHMAVAGDGSHVGSLSGGCIEKAVVAEALRAIETGEPHTIAYGAGTPIIDIRLPCGGRVDLLFTPLTDGKAVEQVRAAHAARQPVSLVLPTQAAGMTIGPDHPTGWNEANFVVRHVPPLQLAILGHGGTVEALVKLAAAMEIVLDVFTPEEDIAARLGDTGATIHLLRTPDDTAAVTGDAWTAFAFFFHDHDWEGALLASALAQPSLFVGAMGSRRTHEARLAMLEALGVAQADRARVVSPIGLIPSSRDPETLALSTLAQVVDRYNRVIEAA